ncbi:LamG-like jellyroll fold domain-containing protein [Salinimicrobium terrae]|uniref:LamG-like jellyroll fold domain-containing protein n=1 Tax=Salinimicrobium terrae TaxID=470866 RepID=UPI0012EB0AB6|nr:LamG-like jellyroll fold domain-containing protein [Salinimicrobium terrae]
MSWTMTGATTGGANGQVGTKIFNIGTTTINYKVIDAANRTISGAIEITVTDEEDPKITLGNDIFDSTGAGQCTASIAVPNVIFSDNCSGETLSWTMTGATSGSANGQVGTKTFNIGTTTINYTVTDAANRTITGAVEVTVTDEEDPKITLGNDIFDTTDPGQCTASIVVPDVSFSDNCSGETLSWNFSGVTTGNGSGQVGPKTFNIGTTTINYNVTDAANRTITGTVEVTVTDEEDPKITLGNDIFDTTDPGQCTASIAIPDAVFSDNCSGEVLSWSLSGVTTGSGSGQVGTKTFNRGITTITYTVTDETGNFMEAIQKVTVNDNEAPVITDLPDITGECPITVIPPTTVDNCDGTITGTTGINDLTFYSSGSIFWIFTDASGNPTGPIEQKIIISDTTAPVPDHNGNLPIISITGCQVSSISELTIPTATDGCEGVIQGSLGEGFQFPYSFYGSNTIEWEFIDSHGNKSAQVQEIELIQVNINGGNLSGIYESVVFDEQIDITSCGEEISVELQLAGKTGNIVHWEKFAVNEGVWEVIPVNDNKHTAVFPVGALESTYYRVLVQAGTCTEYSNSIYIRALPPGAAPTVTNEDLDNEYCLGDTVNLKATSNYLGTQDAIPDSPGDFNEGQLNTKDYDSWLVDGKIRNFTAGGNATKPKNWSGTNNHEFGGIEYDSQDGKFTIAQGNFYGVDKNGKSVYDGNIPTTLESPITDFSNSVSASIDFDQAFYFADDDVATIEISFDGGQNYETLQVMHATGSGVKKWLTAGTAESIDGSDATNYNFNTDNTSISLAAYFDGRDMSNVRIRWSFTGTSDQSVWAMDNIFLNKKIPIETDVEWTEGIGDPDEEPIAIGKTEQKLSFQPDIPGVHSYGGTALINGCRTYSEEGTGLIEILVSYPYAGNDIIMSSEECGKNTVQLNAYDNTITANENNAKGAFSIPDSGCRTCDARGTQVKGSWSSVREGGEPSCLAGSFSDPNDPNSTFTAGAGTYTLTWTLENGCSDETTVTILECDQVNFDGVDDHIDFNNNYNFDGAFSLEVWVKPESINGTHTIFSKRDANLSGSALGYDLKIVDGIVSFNWNKSGTVASPFVINQNRWYHLALIHTEAGEYKLYIDGLLIKVVGGGSPGTNNFRAILGAMDSSGSDGPKYNFNGWIDELRIWKAALTKDQLHRMMNQRIKEDGTEVIGEVIPIHIPDVNWSDLVGYYRMDNIIIGCGEIDPDVGFNGRLVNITSAQENTAPLPYTLFTDNGNWYDTTTWQLPVPYNGINISQRNVWNAPNSLGINGDRINWNIVELNGRKVVNPASSGNIILLGLLDDSGTLDLEGANNSSGTSLTVTHYLELNGILDLNGESQLLQPEGSIIEGSGYLERDQQGTASSYNYNYWSSPVSTQYLAPNSGFKIGEKKGDEYLGVLFDGTDPATPKEIQFNYQYHFADGAPSNPIKISTYWLNKFFGKAGEYSSWKHVTPDSQMAAGEGFTMKGSSGHKEIYHSQNYTFRGMPNNGPITLNIGLDQNYLIGNPYPSAIDANQFIRDNLKDVPGGTNSENVFNGSLYFWSHFAEKTHILKEYVGGYAIYNLAGGVHAIASDARINNSKPNRKGGKKPRQYIPVGQGFFINTVLNPALTNNPNITISGGTVMFNNGQRVFQTESDSTKAVFHSVEKKGINSEPTTGTALREEEKMRLWIKFKSPKGYHRQLLVTMDPKTTSDFDLGYDALLIENNKEDMYWLMGQEQTELLIQGVPDFAPERVLLLGLKIATEGEFIIAIDEMENIPAELPIFLKNIETNTYYNLRDSDFKSKIEIGKIHGRYSIVFDDGDPGDPEDPEDGSGEDDGNDESEDEEDPGDGSSESNGNDEDNGNEEGDGKEDISEEPEDSGPTSRGMELIYSTKNKEIVINNPELSIVKKVVLFNSLGQEIYTYESIDSKVVIELPVEVPSEGMYFIRVYTEEAILVLKFLVD